MSNLLDKASIILTPTAYNNGEALCVKPSDGSGDFDFSRNSAATRVNAQGLVENVQILSSNLVQNGDFSEEGAEEVSNGSFSQEGSELVTNGDFATDSDWVKGNGITIDGGKANFVNSTGDLRQDPVVENGKYYKVTYTISNYVSGSVRFEIPSNIGSGIERSANGTYTEILLSSGTAIQFDARTSFTGSIDNVSVREVGQDWTLGTGWSIAEDKVVYDGLSGTQQIVSGGASVAPQVGKTYKVSFDVLEQGSGANSAFFGGVLFSSANLAVGSYVFYVTATSTSRFGIFGRNGSVFSITNISVKEVAQDWENPVYSGDNSASLSIDNGALKIEKNANLDWRSSFVSQTPITYVSGKTYKITYSLKDGTTSGADVYVRTNFDRSANTVNVKALTNDWVEYTDYYVADTSADDISFGVLAWQNTGSGQYYFIDNISIIEISTDTSLPRINYEGFSYQDALGSELNPNTYIADKSANLTLNGTQLQIDNGGENYARARANVVLVSGKTYRAKVTCINQGTNGASFYVLSARPFGTINMISGETYEVTFVADSFYTPFYENKVGGSGLIVDNISIKEYLGQSVVPDSGCGSWLWEPQTTQLVPYSEDFSQYSVGGSPTINGGFLAPDGTNNAYKITNSGSSTVYLSGIPNLSSTSTRSIYARSVSGTGTASLMSYFGNTNNLFTLTEQWQRFEVNVTTTITGESNFYAADFRGSGTLTEYLVWGANATNDQDYATSYIPSNGSQVTRNQDLCTNGGSLASINSTEGVLYAEINTLNQTGTFRQINLSNGTTSSRVYISKRADNANLEFRMDNPLGGLNFSFAVDTTSDFVKVAFRYGVNNFAVFINGVNKNVSPIGSTFALGTLNDLQFSSPINQPFFGKTKALAVWKEALSDAELTELTTI